MKRLPWKRLSRLRAGASAGAVVEDGFSVGHSRTLSVDGILPSDCSGCVAGQSLGRRLVSRLTLGRGVNPMPRACAYRQVVLPGSCATTPVGPLGAAHGILMRDLRGRTGGRSSRRSTRRVGPDERGYRAPPPLLEVGAPDLLNPEAESRPDGPRLVGLRHAPVPRSPPLGGARSLPSPRRAALGLASIEDHGHALIGLEALVQPLAKIRTIVPDDDEPAVRGCRPGRGARVCSLGAASHPGRGTRMAFVDPPAIAFLAIVVMVRGSRRDWRPPGRGACQTLPHHVPIPGDAPQAHTADSDRPAAPEWVVGRRLAHVSYGPRSHRTPGDACVHTGPRSGPRASGRAGAGQVPAARVLSVSNAPPVLG